LKEIDHKKIVGAVLLDFSAAVDIIDHNLLLGKFMCHGFSTSAKSWIQNSGIKIYIMHIQLSSEVEM
jgi:hypothetical protein